MHVLRVEVRGASIRVRVHVQPRASRSEVVGTHGAALKVRLLAPPVDGAANDALVELLAGLLGVARRDVSIVHGATSREKVVEIQGTTVDAVRALADRGEAASN